MSVIEIFILYSMCYTCHSPTYLFWLKYVVLYLVYHVLTQAFPNNVKYIFEKQTVNFFIVKNINKFIYLTINFIMFVIIVVDSMFSIIIIIRRRRT